MLQSMRSDQAQNWPHWLIEDIAQCLFRLPLLSKYTGNRKLHGLRPPSTMQGANHRHIRA